MQLTVEAPAPERSPSPGPRRPVDPAWARPALVVLLVATAGLYLWGLSDSGWANAFYAAAAQAGSVSWKAFFYGSSDAGNSITVDKTPLAVWVMALSARVFGVNSWSLLVPEALMGVASVGVLYATVRRWSGAVAGLVAGVVLALTPVAVLMFRFDNPDAALVLLLLLGAWALVRAVDASPSQPGPARTATLWLAAAGGFVGLAFLAKMVQAFLVVPAFALVFVLVAAGPLLRRVGQLLLAGLAMLVAGGWWVAVVELVPASSRPYIGGSQHNSVLELMLGYNGLGRLTGDETGSVGGTGGGTGGGAGGWGQTGWTRLFDGEIGGQVAWLLPAALVLLVIGLLRAGRAPRTDRARAGYLLWGGWLVVTALTFSFMAGIFHAYYTVALAPAVGALVGAGSVDLWGERRRWIAAGPVLGLVVGLSALWAWRLLGRSADFVPWLRPIVLVVGVLAGVAIAVSVVLPRRAALAAAGAGLLVVLAGPAAYAVQTAGTAHTGSIPTAGPQVTGGRFGGGPGGPGGLRGGGPGGGQLPAGGQSPGQGQFAGRGQLPGGGQFPGGVTTDGGRGGAMGGLLDATTPSTELVAALTENASSYTWVAATVGANNAAGYQLATGAAVMPLGGFNGSDPSPTVEQFEEYVAAGRIHYFLGGGIGMRSDSGSDTAQQIAAWVQQNFTSTTIGGTTVYDLTAGASSTPAT